MKKETFIRLIDAYLQGSATLQESQIVEAYYQKLEQKGKTLLSAAQEQALQQLMLANILSGIEESATGKQENSPNVKLWPQPAPGRIRRMATVSTAWRTFVGISAWKVAAAVTAITLGTWLYYAPPAVILNLFQDPNAIAMKNDIAPGKNTATLTLANGKVINLSDAKTGVVIGSDLKYSDNTFVIQSDSEGSGSLGTRNGAEVKALVVSTPRGGQYQVVLPDGTKVWLNADSKISFPSQFIEKERKVFLEGEAYFEVAKAFVIQSSAKDLNKRERQPFIVKSAGQQVEVLGTHFNINSYDDEGATKTTLLEGSVRISSLLSSSSLRGRTEASRSNLPGRDPSTTPLVILKPNQQASLKGSSLQVKAIDPAEAVAWKNGYFQFDAEALEQVMRKLSRWYDIDVQYENVTAKDLKFSGTMSRYSNISQVLMKIEAVSNVRYRIEGKTVIIIN